MMKPELKLSTQKDGTSSFLIAYENITIKYCIGRLFFSDFVSVVETIILLLTCLHPPGCFFKSRDFHFCCSTQFKAGE